jgi:hypothetical protein
LFSGFIGALIAIILLILTLLLHHILGLWGVNARGSWKEGHLEDEDDKV